MTTPRNTSNRNASSSRQPTHARRTSQRPAQHASAHQRTAQRSVSPARSRTSATARAPKRSASGKIFAALMLILVVVLGGVGISSLLGGDDASSGATNASPAIQPIQPSPAPEPQANGPKKTAAGKQAVGHVRTPEERKATSDSANDQKPGPKTVYLTFDDGPSTNTHNILRILDDYGVKATWFVKGNQPQLEYVKDIWDAGNQVAIHTYTHNYTDVYASPEAYWKDFHMAGDAIKEHLGFAPTLVRFPGGSHNSYNGAVFPTIERQMADQNIHYFDWNISSGDGGDHEADFIVSYILDSRENDGQNALGCHSVCLLMHDSAAKDTTVEALPRVIEAFIDEDFEFDVLLADSYGYHF